MSQQRFPISESEKVEFMQKYTDPDISGVKRMRSIHGRSPGGASCGDCVHFTRLLDGPNSCTRYDGTIHVDWRPNLVGCGLIIKK